MLFTEASPQQLRKITFKHQYYPFCLKSLNLKCTDAKAKSKLTKLIIKFDTN